MFQLQLFFAPLWRMGPRCSSAETQVCHRSYIISASILLVYDYESTVSWSSKNKNKNKKNIFFLFLFLFLELQETVDS